MCSDQTLSGPRTVRRDARAPCDGDCSARSSQSRPVFVAQPRRRTGAPPASCARRNGAPGRVNRAPRVPPSMKNPRSRNCGRVQDGRAVVHRCGGYPHRLTELDQIGHVHRVEPAAAPWRRNSSRSGSAQHDGDLMLTEFRKPDHRAYIQPVLTGQTIDPDPAVGGAHDAQHRSCLRVRWAAQDFSAVRPSASGTASVDRSASKAETSTSITRSGPGVCDPQGRQGAERGVTARDVLGDTGAGLHRGPVGFAGFTHPAAACRVSGVD